MKKYSSEWFLYHLRNNGVSRWVSSSSSLYLLAITKDSRKPLDLNLPFKINQWEDLECFEETESWHNKKYFLSNAQEQLNSGAICVTLVQNQQLAFISWVKPESTKSTFGSVKQTVFYPPYTSTQYSGYVHPNHRGKRIFVEGLNFLAHYVFDETDTKLAVAAVDANNLPAMKSHLTSGFEPIARFDTTQLFGNEKFYMAELTPHYKFSRVNTATWRLEAAG